MLIQIHINEKLIKNFFGVVVVRNRCGQSGCRTLKLTVTQKCADGVNRFFNTGANSGKLKVALIVFGWLWSKMGMIF